MRTFSRARLATVAVVMAVVAGTAAVTVAGPADAAVRDPGVSGTASPQWQTNGAVEALAVSRGVLYAGGTFSRVRPPGAAAGANETARANLAAFDATTGALVTSFNVNVNGRVDDMAVSPNGNLLYIVGTFTTVNGVARQRVAALNLPSGSLNTSFVANAGATTTAVTATPNAVYVSGDWARINNVAKNHIAALNPATGAVLPAFAAGIELRANVLTLVPDGSRLLVGGNFTTVNGQTTGVNGAPVSGIASVDPTTGAIQRWDASLVQPVGTACRGRVSDIVVSGSTAFVTAEGDLPGCYEGVYSADLSDGHINWNLQCLGASQGVAVVDGILYRGDHQHDCAYSTGGPAGGFVGGTFRDAFAHHYLTANTASDGSFIHWTPSTNATGAGGVGPHTMATDGSQLFVAGDFTRVNNVPQQGIARFVSAGNRATPKTPGLNIMADPFPNTTLKLASRLEITAIPTRAGTLTVKVPTVEDIDSGTLTYRIYRDNGTNPVNVQTAESYPWTRPVLRFDDTGLAPGSTHTYRVTASDGTFTSARSTAISGTVSASAPPALPAAYGSVAPQLWWQLGENGPTFADSGTNGTHSGLAQGGVSSAPGAGTNNTGVTLDGSTGYLTSADTIAAPTAFTESAWFKTTTVRGGNILAQSTVQTDGGPETTDRIVTMDNNGGLVFAVRAPGNPSPFGTPSINVRNQGPIWNDGAWHQVTATYDGTTASLYVDGALQASGAGTAFDPTAKAVGMANSYQRAGYANLDGLQMVFGINFYNRHWPASDHFSGSLDEVASFPTALSQAQVRALYAAGVGGGA